MAKLLCIDDDLDLCTLLKRFLTKNGYEVEVAYTGNSGLKRFEAEPFDLVLCDFRLPDKDGLDMMKALKKIRHQVPVILITAYSDVKVAVKAVKMGAFEYVSKPILPDEILVTVEKALESAGQQNPVQQTSTEPESNKAKSQPLPGDKPEYVIGNSQTGKQIQNLIELVAPTDMTVIILGESGTGKEVAAQAIHHYSKRKDKPFLAVDCGALSPELAGSELFGHKKGSFTGALSDKRGYFQLADGGTLFLDEIGNLSYENQVKLLRVLQERKVRMIGDEKDFDVDVRLIVATNENLKKKVAEGSFRQDIYYRLHEFTISLPALRERKEDIELFTDYFLKMANRQLNKEVTGVEDQVLEKFRNYSWPGNLRELKNILKRCTLFAGKGRITVKDLPQEIVHPVMLEMDEPFDENDEIINLRTATERAERKAILNALVKTNFNKSKTAELLKVDRKTLYTKMNDLGIET